MWLLFVPGMGTQLDHQGSPTFVRRNQNMEVTPTLFPIMDRKEAAEQASSPPIPEYGKFDSGPMVIFAMVPLDVLTYTPTSCPLFG